MSRPGSVSGEARRGRVGRGGGGREYSRCLGLSRSTALAPQPLPWPRFQGGVKGTVRTCAPWPGTLLGASLEPPQ